MKKVFLSVMFILFISSLSFAQNEERPGEKIRALEKLKLLEVLDLDEETAIKFFARRKEHQERIKKLYDEAEEKRKKIRAIISSTENDDDPEIKKMVKSYFTTHQQIDEERMRFINSLDDILTNRQLAELTLFEKRFREEIRDILFHKRKKLRKQ